MKRRLLFWIFLFTIASGARAGENWPQWRGPHLNGTANAKDLPMTWSEDENIVWKVPLPSWSGSTPVIWGDRIFLNSPTQPEPGASKPKPDENEEQSWRAKYRREPGGDEIDLMCFDRNDGSLIWKRPLIATGNVFIMKQNMSSPSPQTDGKRVWSMTGTGEVVCFDFDGNEKWRFNIQKRYGKFGLNHGYGSSALLYRDRLIIPVLHGMNTDDPSYLLAVDKETGKEIWREERPTDAIRESPDSYATPQVLHYADGRDEIVINGGDVVTASDPETGKEIWRVGGLNPQNNPWQRTIASCVTADGMVYAPTRVQPFHAIRGGGKGDVTATHVAWTAKGPDVPTPLSDGQYVWAIDDRGVALCYEAKSGEEIFTGRIASGTYSASPLMADGKIYATSESCVTTVIEAGPALKILATNELDDPYTLASPIAVGNRIYIRGASHLYCIGSKDGPES